MDSTISQTSQEKGALQISSSVDFWYQCIWHNITILGQYLCGFLNVPADKEPRDTFTAFVLGL
jgi:hypothetical protein